MIIHLLFLLIDEFFHFALVHHQYHQGSSIPEDWLQIHVMSTPKPKAYVDAKVEWNNYEYTVLTPNNLDILSKFVPMIELKKIWKKNRLKWYDTERNIIIQQKIEYSQPKYIFD